MPLYLIATPIGNLEDITYRAVRLLGEVDRIACEDTRHTRHLLTRYGIATPTISYHEHNEAQRIPALLAGLLRGESLALVSDAGTPGISDPGHRLVRAAIEQGIEVVPIPGPTACIAALIASGLPTDSFFFVGFLPARQQARRTRLEEIRPSPATLLLHEAPHRLRETLVDASQILGDRVAVVARELTKFHEQFHSGSLSELAEYFTATPPRGEMTLVIAGCRDHNQDFASPGHSLVEEVARLQASEGVSPNEALRRLARQSGLSRRDLYRQYLDERGAGLPSEEGESFPPESSTDDSGPDRSE